MNVRILLYAVGLVLAAGRSELSAAPDAAAAAKTYPVHGVVQQVAPDRRQATIKHDAIAGYMAAMTMDFPVRDTNILTGIAAGDEVTFTLAVTATDDWIENVKRISSANPYGFSGPPG